MHGRYRTIIFGRPFVKRFALCYQTVVCLSCPVLSVTFVHCGQTVGRTKMKLGMQVGLGHGHNVLDGDHSTSPKGDRAPSPIFGPFLLWPNGWMHRDATWYACRPQPRGLCVRWRPSPLPKKGAEPPNFRPMFIVSCRTRVKRLDACAQIHYLCVRNYRMRVKYSGESRDVTGVICAKNRLLQYVQSYRCRNICVTLCRSPYSIHFMLKSCDLDLGQFKVIQGHGANR